MLGVLLVALTASPAPSPTSTAPVYWGKPAVRMALDARPLGFDPDGNARWLVVTKFFDAQGHATRIMENSDFAWVSRDGYVQWQTRLRYEQPSAILKTVRDGPLTMKVYAQKPSLGSAVVRTDTRAWRWPRVVAEALGPHLVSIGWFPQEHGTVRVTRIDSRGREKIVALVAGPSSSFADTTVAAKSAYRYVVVRAHRASVTLAPISTPPLPPRSSVADASGKGMWLFFTDNPFDDIYFGTLDPQAVVDQAVRAGLHYVELRLAYGAYWEVTPESKPVVDAIVDGLAAHGIGAIAWTVPRDTSFEDLKATIRAASYRTANGTPVRGVAIDLERGDDFMGGAPQGNDALWQYVRAVREALGPRTLIVSTVEDPFFERLDNDRYPYAQIARFSDVLQPMAYWRMFAHKPTPPSMVSSMLRASYRTILADAGRRIPVSLGGQTSADDLASAPAPDEIRASLAVSKAIGAIGECFFAWSGTQPDQWASLRDFPW